MASRIMHVQKIVVLPSWAIPSPGPFAKLPPRIKTAEAINPPLKYPKTAVTADRGAAFPNNRPFTDGMEPTTIANELATTGGWIHSDILYAMRLVRWTHSNSAQRRLDASLAATS